MHYLTRILSLTACAVALAAPICSSAQSGDPALGQVLYNNTCAVCNGTGPNIFGGARLGANDPTRITNAINGVVPAMGGVTYSFLTATNIADIAAYIGVALGSSPPPDTQAPTVPAGLTATVASSSAINLAWTGSTDNVGVTGYRVFQNGGLFGTVTSTGAAVTGLAASTTYSFTVSACDAAGNCSAQSTAVSATTFAVAQPTGDYTGAWYNANESGWGLSVIRGPNTGLYGIIMYHYNQSASPTWYFMSGGSFNGNVYSVPVTLYSGPFFGGPFNPALVTSPVVGSATINFTSATNATLTYTIGTTAPVTKNITKLDF
jgi:cellulose 1,4-beta-cellobiosidase